MMLARVVGRVWATIKNDTLEGKKMLVIQPVDLRGRQAGKPLVGPGRCGCRRCRAGLLLPRPRSFLPLAARRGAGRSRCGGHCGRGARVILARVLGEVVATQKHPSHEGRKILVVQPLQLDGSARGDPVLALDAVDAGVGDHVLVLLEGWAAGVSVERPQSPVDMAVVGVVDSVTLDEGA